MLVVSLRDLNPHHHPPPMLLGEDCARRGRFSGWFGALQSCCLSEPRSLLHDLRLSIRSVVQRIATAPIARRPGAQFKLARPADAIRHGLSFMSADRSQVLFRPAKRSEPWPLRPVFAVPCWNASKTALSSTAGSWLQCSTAI